MKKLLSARRHWPVLLLAIFVGASLAFPAFWFKFHYGVSMRSPANLRSADEFFYLARIKDVLDGYPLSGNPFIQEYKSKIPGQPVFLGEYLSAEIIRLFGLDVVRGNVLLDFLLPMVAVVLSYACLFDITKKRWLSFFGTALLFFWFFPGAFARTPSPQLDFIFWLSLFCLLYFFMRQELRPRARYVILFCAAINFGLLFYLYTYYWTFYLAFFGIAFLLALVWKAYGYARAAVVIVGGGAVVAIPYFLLISRVIFLPEYAETVRRIGMINTHFPSGIAVVVPAFLLFGVTGILVYYSVVPRDKFLLFFMSGIAATVVSVNQHIITGKNLEFSSHYLMLSVFWFVFYVMYLIGIFLQKMPRFEKTAVAAAGVILVFVIPHSLLAGALNSVPAGGPNIERYVPLLDWLDKNTAKDSVVYAPPEIVPFIPIYTADNVFWAPFTQLTMMPDSEIMDRFILSNFYRDPFDRNFVESSIRSVYGVYYIDVAAHALQENKVRALFGLSPVAVVPVPRDAVDRVLARYHELKKGDFEKEIGRFRIDYFVVDADLRKSFPFERMPSLTEVYADDTFIVYRTH